MKDGKFDVNVEHCKRRAMAIISLPLKDKIVPPIARIINVSICNVQACDNVDELCVRVRCGRSILLLRTLHMHSRSITCNA